MIRSRVALVAVIALALLLPAGAAALLAWSAASQSGAVDRIPVAVVNEDEIVHQPRTTAAGRELAGALVDPAKNNSAINLDWTLTNASDAADGLKNGSYEAVLTIPRDFSADVVSLDTDKPQRAEVSLRTTESSSTAAAISSIVSTTAVDELGEQITTSYVDHTLQGLTSTSKNLKKSADSASGLNNGARQTASGASKLSSSAGSLASGMDAAASGAGQLSSGSQALATSASQLAAGTQQLSSSSAQLATGTRTLDSSAATVASRSAHLDAAAGQLARGTHQTDSSANDVASGARQLSSTTAQLASGADSVGKGTSATADSAAGLAKSLQHLADACPRAATAYCGQVEAVAQAGQQLASGARSAADGAAKLSDSTSAVADGANTVSSGAGRLTRGTSRLASSATDLSNGAHSLADGTAKLAAGTHTVATSTRTLASSTTSLASATSKLSSGSRELSSSADSLSGGIGSAASGAHSLDTASSSLSKGANSVASGSSSLHQGLESFAQQVPQYGDTERDAITKVAADPVHVAGGNTIGSNTLTNIVLGLGLPVALWLSALCIDVIRRRRNARAVTAALISPTRSLLVWQLAMPVLLGAASGSAVGVAVTLVTDAAAPNMLVLISALAGATFTALAQAMRSLFPRSGTIAYCLALIVQVACSAILLPLATLPQPLRSLNSAFPLDAYGTGVVHAVAGGPGSSTATIIASLAGWLVVSLLAATAGLLRMRRRQLTCLPVQGPDSSLAQPAN